MTLRTMFTKKKRVQNSMELKFFFPSVVLILTVVENGMEFKSAGGRKTKIDFFYGTK